MRRRRKRKTKVTKRPRGYSNSTLDKLWSKKVKELAAFRCEICGAKPPVEAHHIHKCKHYGVRWNVINGVCLCRDCHCNSPLSAHKNQLWFFREMLLNWGDDWADDLINATAQFSGIDWRERLVEIKEKLQ